MLNIKSISILSPLTSSGNGENLDFLAASIKELLNPSSGDGADK